MCAIIVRGNQIILGYSQAVRHQTLTLPFSLVRIQLSQPKREERIAFLSFWLGYKCETGVFAKQKTRWFAFESKSDGSLLTRGRTKNLREANTQLSTNDFFAFFTLNFFKIL